MILSLKTVRNNVMHGGKFPFGHGDEPTRDEQLIRGCVALLVALSKAEALNGAVPNLEWDF